MNLISSSLLMVILFHENFNVMCNMDRPTRREIQTNRSVFLYACIGKRICEEYAEQNALKHIDCEVLCDMSWKWAQSEVDSDPLFTLPPVQDTNDLQPDNIALNSNTTHGLTNVTKTSETKELREKPSQSKKHVGRESVGHHNEGVSKSEDQVGAEKLKRKHKKARDEKKSPVKSISSAVSNDSDNNPPSDMATDSANSASPSSEISSESAPASDPGDVSDPEISDSNSLKPNDIKTSKGSDDYS
jgi:hypothetical protein